MHKIKIALLIFCAPAWAAHFDPPDLNFEFELHRQHLRSAGLLELQKRSRDGITESYRIQSGDTLWSLSRMLYGDGHFWPKVWAQNQDISNPHLIRPGHTLQFLMGSEDDTPAFRFTEEDEEANLELVASVSNPMIEIPPPDDIPVPVAPIPKSFPYYQPVYTGGLPDVVDKTIRVQKAGKIPDRIFLSAYVQEDPINALGNFDDSDGEYGLPIVNQHVYLRVRIGQVKVGDKLQVVKQTGRIRRINSQWDGARDIDIYHIQVAAEVEVTERIQPDNEEPEEYEIVRALMTKTLGLSLKEFSLVRGDVPIIDMSYNGQPGVTGAQIIGSERDNASALYGPGDIIFLDKGIRDGVRAGHIMDIFTDRTIRDPNAKIRFSPNASGKVKVVRVTSRLSTAVVLESHDGLMQGDSVQVIGKNAILDEEADRADDEIEESIDDPEGEEAVEDSLFNSLDEADEAELESELESESQTQ